MNLMIRNGFDRAFSTLFESVLRSRILEKGQKL